MESVTIKTHSRRHVHVSIHMSTTNQRQKLWCILFSSFVILPVNHALLKNAERALLFLNHLVNVYLLFSRVPLWKQISCQINLRKEQHPFYACKSLGNIVFVYQLLLKVFIHCITFSGTPSKPQNMIWPVTKICIKRNLCYIIFWLGWTAAIYDSILIT